MAQNAKNAVDGVTRRYRRLIAVEVVLIAATVSNCALLPAFMKASGGFILCPLIFLCLWHLLAIPYCVMYLIGKPQDDLTLVMSFRMNATAESLAFRKEVKKRPALTDELFYARLYQGSTVPEDVPARVRQLLRDLDSLANRLIPTDQIGLLLDDELILEFQEIEREFGIRLTEADYALFDGTLGNLILFICQRTSGAAC